ncbi:MAG: recombinase family protein [Bacteroidetes bacterium]|nr:recombinase family protein [Bacteroidota bacterium]
MINYFLYARKSSESEERQVMSIEAQLTELREYALKEKINIIETFTESKSAKQPGRMEFNRMIAKIYETKEPIGIIAWHPDRLARNSMDGGQIIYLIDIKKISVLRFPTFWFEPTPQGLLMLNNAFGQSKYYSDNLSENVKRGIRQKIRRGEWIGKAPVGYTNNYKTRNIEPDPIKAKIIKQLFMDYADGKYSMNSARERLKYLGIESKSAKMISVSKVEWILTNPLYYGVIKHKEEYHEGKFEPLISRETFDAVQRRLKERSQPRKSKHRHDFGFTGLLTCGECGCAITAQFAKGNGGTYRYYRCTKKRVKCSQGYLREDLMLSQLRAELQKISLPDEWVHKMQAQIDLWEKESQGEIILFAQNLDSKLKEVDIVLDKLVNGFLEGIIDKDTYLKKKSEIINEKQSLQQRKTGLGQKGLLWLEPLRDWLKVAHSAASIASSTEMNKIKSILQKSGTNHSLRDKKIGLDFLTPYSYISKYKGGRGNRKRMNTKNKMGESVNFTDSPIWWALLESNQPPTAPIAIGGVCVISFSVL